MTVGELLNRIGSHEVTEWLHIFEWEDEQRRKREV